MLAAAWPSAVQIWRVNAGDRRLAARAVTARSPAVGAGKNFAAVSARARRAVGNFDEGRGFRKRRRRRPFGHHGPRPGRERLRNEVEPSSLLAATARTDRPASRCGLSAGDVGDVERGEARVGDGIRGEEDRQASWNADLDRSAASWLSHSATDTRCLPKTKSRQRPTVPPCRAQCAAQLRAAALDVICEQGGDG